MKVKVKIGDRYGRLKVAGRAANGKNRGTRWLCDCDCGRASVVWGTSLIQGLSKSCGCLSVEITVARCRTHGESSYRRTAEYRAWINMITRCENKKRPGYRRYGGRGIVICKRWRESYFLFLQDVGRRPTPKHSLERVRNDSGYEPSNVIWATRRTQNNNKCSTRYLTSGGVTLSVAEWARKIGVTYSALISRVQRGWSTERALTP
jgi:hypothetical protein